jgi:Heterodisulfide reductase, subunit C
MNKFGFCIQKDNQIDYDKADRRVAIRVAEVEPTFNICINCGTCAATCSAAQFTDFSFRKICILVRRGLTDAVKDQLKHCMMCGKCQLACPRGVNTRNIILQLKKTIIELEK